MQKNLLVHFDRVRVINLPERMDRRRAMTDEMQRLGFTPNAHTFFSAYKVDTKGPFISPGAHGCYLSHAAVISEAATAGESLLILEDDCAFHSAAASFPIPACDIFWGGWNEMTNDGDFVIGSHCLGFSAATIQLLHGYLMTFLDNPPDARAMTEPNFDPKVRPGIDGVYVWFRRAYPGLQTCFANITYQRSSRSDVTPGRFDNVPIVGHAADLLRRAKNALTSRQ